MTTIICSNENIFDIDYIKSKIIDTIDVEEFIALQKINQIVSESVVVYDNHINVKNVVDL